MSMELRFPGNEAVRLRLERALATERLAKSYLFEGSPGAGQEQAAVELAVAHIVGDCSPDHPDAQRVRRFSHPDLHYLLPVVKTVSKPWGDLKDEELLGLFREQQGRKAADPYYLPEFSRQPHLPIEAVRVYQRLLDRKPYEGLGQVLILREAEQMKLDCQDTMLKTLEEPPPNTLIILISTMPEALRPTILSRCQRVPFDPLAPEVLERLLTERGLELERARFFATLSEGNLELAVQLAAAEGEEGNPLLERRDLYFDLLDRCELGSELDMMDAVQEFIRQGKKENPARRRADFLAQAVSWYRELLRLSLEPGAPRVHVDQTARIERYAHLGSEDLLERIRGCEKARGQILSYVHAELTLLTLFFSFRARKSAPSVR